MSDIHIICATSIEFAEPEGIKFISPHPHPAFEGKCIGITLRPTSDVIFISSK